VVGGSLGKGNPYGGTTEQGTGSNGGRGGNGGEGGRGGNGGGGGGGPSIGILKGGTSIPVLVNIDGSGLGPGGSGGSPNGPLGPQAVEYTPPP
jgi:hypothetical protein